MSWLPRAHPRSRGENTIQGATSCGYTGSSPLTRGKHAAPAGAGERCGLIPAHAGKTGRQARGQVAEGAHPRSRGENAAEETAVDIHLGSSPLTRGKPRVYRFIARSPGLIPAHAGKTDDRYIPLIKERAHPRSRGENGRGIRRCRRGVGSSPLTRGKLIPIKTIEHSPGLIPAHAGKTFDGGGEVAVDGAHPRSRGENVPAVAAFAGAVGSSPLTRGKQSPKPRARLSTGLIPAHAGKTGGRAARAPPGWAHPRSRGENRDCGLAGRRELGSSPLTRGKPPRPHHRRDRGRLIPAHAGKTDDTGGETRVIGAHPRSRGENEMKP